MKPAKVSITINGRKELICLPCTVARILETGGLKVTQIVVEHNGKVLPRAQLAETFLRGGDNLEVIVPVAGG
jgi:sulfur carrier protein